MQLSLYSTSRASKEGCPCRSEIKLRAEEDNSPIPGIDVREELNNWLKSNLLASESSKNSDCSDEESNQVHLAFRSGKSIFMPKLGHKCLALIPALLAHYKHFYLTFLLMSVLFLAHMS